MAQGELVAYYTIGMGLGGLFVSGFFLTVLNQNDGWEYQSIAYKFTAALTFFSISTLTQLLSNTWTVPRIAGFYVPSLQVVFDALVLGFMISGIWDFWSKNLD